MRVRAVKIGYYNHGRKLIGDEFELKPIKGFVKDTNHRKTPKLFTVEDQFSKAWMEKVLDEDDAPKAKKKAQPKEEIFQDDEVI